MEKREIIKRNREVIGAAEAVHGKYHAIALHHRAEIARLVCRRCVSRGEKTSIGIIQLIFIQKQYKLIIIVGASGDNHYKRGSISRHHYYNPCESVYSIVYSTPIGKAGPRKYIKRYMAAEALFEISGGYLE